MGGLRSAAGFLEAYQEIQSCLLTGRKPGVGIARGEGI